MNALTAARSEWEAATKPFPLPHRQSYGEVIEDPFRSYGEAIALLEWDDYCIILKIETLRPRSGAATRLLSFLKELATKHGIRIHGNPVVYAPTCPQAAASPLSQKELDAWYAKNGFAIGQGDRGVPCLCFPPGPKG